MHAKFLFSGSSIYKYGVGRRQALSLEAALVTPVIPRVIPNPRVRIVQDFIFLTFQQRSPVILFPGECGTVYYSPYKSEQIKLQEPDGNAIYKRKKVNAQGILYEHYEYSLAKLRRQNLQVCRQMQDIIALPETTTGN